MSGFDRVSSTGAKEKLRGATLRGSGPRDRLWPILSANKDLYTRKRYPEWINDLDNHRWSLGGLALWQRCRRDLSDQET